MKPGAASSTFFERSAGMAKTSLHIELLGAAFSISADEDPVYLNALLGEYRRSIENTRKITGLEDPLKLAIITGFLLCDDFNKLASQNPRVRDSLEAEKLAQELISRLDKSLITLD
jgi:cell division protein ZapA (FtsZ GTPase activity inhibitor)